jgi:hypothetical protein
MTEQFKAAGLHSAMYVSSPLRCWPSCCFAATHRVCRHQEKITNGFVTGGG